MNETDAVNTLSGMLGTAPRLFTWVDYLLFAVILVITALIGVYYAWKGAKGTSSDFLTGGKQLGIFPIAMSLAAG